MLLIPATVVLLLVGAANVAILINRYHPPAAITYTPGAANSAPTATFDVGTLQPTTTPPLPPVLGDSLDAFTTNYGAPTSAGSDTATFTTTLQGYDTQFQTYTQPSASGAPRVISVTLSFPGDSPDEQTALAITGAFAPADAHYITTIAAPDGSPEPVYRSATLARTFPASDFQTNASQTIPAGTFSISCSANTDGSNTIHDCLIAPGHD